ncbi:NAD-dependent succinate-semialdehyde dehydrogenase [Paenibacillus roseipurpureus]|uniref:NAD-dependent succinate-semialdehyde dehydrogenase n=1 Tax=Paenibacillus roseopurpureus TaxID=2918901 RepID=A0AA96RL42_9BACL|nr:NAD-dependent succinate-semialdehyde dehydrogenase [Paenibacillus sp. MBLB1832]WNR47058.1 NAD-dependent succinate-semialdehyde dehydrogenase [Paenibacillus sp. MBLB1832]
MRVYNPATGEVVGKVPKGGGEAAMKAVDAADQALTAWRQLTAKERGRYLCEWADRILLHRDELSILMSKEQGKPVEEAKGELEGSAEFIRWYAEEGKRIYGETIPGSSKNQRIMVWRQPIGIVGMITPWNYPAAMVVRKVAPALAAGCTVVVKPARQTPLIAVALFQLLIETGLPNGVANLVTGDATEIGQVLLTDSRVRKISFTGSTEVGKHIMQSASKQLKRLSLELGGIAPVLVFPDADLDLAADCIVSNKFENCGQVCNGINLIYAHEDIRASLSEKIVSNVRQLRVGVGTELGMDVGPLIDQAALERVERLVSEAAAKGAKILTGGHRLEEGDYAKGYFYAPTVLDDVHDEMALTKEEIFGPVAPILAFQSEEEVIARCNNTPYGLAAYLFTRDVSRVYRVCERLEFGMVAVNGTSLSVPQAPFGGIKESGMGREGGHHGLEEFLDLKYIHLKIED